MSGTQTLLALATYPESSAATRFRVTQLAPYLRARGWELRFEPFLDEEFFGGFYAGGDRFDKARYLASRSFARLSSAIRANDVDAVLIQREASMIGPAYAETILHAFKRLPLIFDFDDAIWQYDFPRSTYPLAARLLRNPGKCWRTMRHAALVIAGSSYLAERAREVNAHVEVAPTVVSSTAWTPLPGRLDGSLLHAPPRIGWVGSHSTAHQLELVEPALARLRDEGHDFELHVVGAGDDFNLRTVDLETRPWRGDEELHEFQQIDIGLAPMHGQPIYEGKCGFKQLQYMAVGVPFVSSWVGGARDFVVDGENGLVAQSTDDWHRHLKALLQSRELRSRLARNGRRLVESTYCIERQGPRLVHCFEAAIARAR